MKIPCITQSWPGFENSEPILAFADVRGAVIGYEEPILGKKPLTPGHRDWLLWLARQQMREGTVAVKRWEAGKLES